MATSILKHQKKLKKMWTLKSEFNNDNYNILDLNTLTSAEVEIIKNNIPEFIEKYYN